MSVGPREIVDLFKATAKEFVEDKTPKSSAALAYYTLFALGPLLIVAVGIASLVFGSDTARDAVMAQLERFLGPSGSEGVAELLAGADDRTQGSILATIGGTVLLLVSAGAVFAQLKEALNRMWEVEAKKAVGWKEKVVKAARKNFLSFAGVIGTGFLLLVSLLLTTAVAAMGEYVGSAFPGSETILQVANLVVSLAIVSLVFALMFKFLPDARVAWRDVWIGAVFTAVLFLAGQFALGYYLGAGPLSTRYGAASAVLVILVWVYYASMIVFFGAQFTQVFANRHGSRVREGREGRSLREAVAQEQSEPEQEGVERRKEKKGRGTA